MSDYISRQAAIKTIEGLHDCYNGFSDCYDKACIIGVLEEVPAADVVEVVRCKDCVYYNGETHGCVRNPCVEPWYETDFCNYGGRHAD